MTREEKKKPIFERPPARERLIGKLITIYDTGYGFISLGPGETDVFVAKKQVPVEAWMVGRKFSFLLAAPRPGTRAPRAENIQPVEES